MIRKAAKKDYRRIADIFVAEYSKKPYLEKWNKKQGMKFVKTYARTGNIFVAVDHNKILGSMILKKKPDNIGFLMIVEEIAVDSSYQGKGIGRKLMEKAEEECKYQGCHSIRLLTHNKSGAAKFYQKIGFRKTKDILYFSKKIR